MTDKTCRKCGDEVTTAHGVCPRCGLRLRPADVKVRT
jgi:RNA polymerase subunit RPABC4/transcription elongation factor Spt4